MKIRKYKQADSKEIYELFYNTVHSINLKDYTQEQVNVWAKKEVNLEAWNKSLLENYTIVVIKDEIIVGFGDMDDKGFLDRLYVHKDYQGQGVASLILNDLERHAKDNCLETITTNASVTLKPLLEKRGYITLKERTVEIKDHLLTNFHMVKKL